ncbi:g11134 [Coccomyxa elongata]
MLTCDLGCVWGTSVFITRHRGGNWLGRRPLQVCAAGRVRPASRSRTSDTKVPDIFIPWGPARPAVSEAGPDREQTEKEVASASSADEPPQPAPERSPGSAGPSGRSRKTKAQPSGRGRFSRNSRTGLRQDRESNQTENSSHAFVRQRGGRTGSDERKLQDRRTSRPHLSSPEHAQASLQQRHSSRKAPSERAASHENLFGASLVRRGPGSTATFFTQSSFKDVGASDEMVKALRSIGIERPSFIQAAAYQVLMSGARHIVLADHAGSGKTLAYLLPLVQALREEEQSLCDSLTMRNAPRVIVIAPTTELCAQVLMVARGLAKGAPFRAIALTGGFKWKTQKEALEEGVDVVVATPGRLGEHIKAGNLRLHQCRAVVLDEVDVLLGDTFAFAQQVAPLRSAAPESTRFVLVTATLAEPVYLQLQQDFPGITPAFGPGLHRTAPGVLEQLVDCSGGDVINEETGFERKAAALLRVLKEQGASRTIVFCNKIETCRKVENLLKRKGDEADKEDLMVLPYHAAIEDGVRSKALKTFLAPPMGGPKMVLVCTDRASRGIDSAHVEHVVLFDFPRDPSEYVRRAGRVSRGAGASGVVSILVLGRQVSLAKQLLERNQKGLPIHKVPSG